MEIIETNAYLTDDNLWSEIKKGDICDLQNRIKYLLRVYGTTLPCNRFDIGNSIEFLLAHFITQLGFRVEKLPNAKRIDLCINETYKLSIKYSSIGDITLHNSNSCINKDEIMTDLILLTPKMLYLITNNNLKQYNIDAKLYLKNTGDSLKLKRTLLTKLDNIKFQYRLSVDISIDKSLCENKSCAEVFYEKAMEDYDKLESLK
tara:strand:- start:1906 stop:2517 length:612 start_codon:yes stop_codon:yes gene_type:complete